MFDINLIKKPGLQNNHIDDNISSVESDSGDNDIMNKNIEIKSYSNSKYYFFTFERAN